MKAPQTILPALFLLAATFVASAQEPQWLQYRVSREPERHVGGSLGHVQLTPTTRAPGRVALPELEQDDPLFAPWKTPMAKDDARWIALARSRKHGQYDRLYIDADGDGSLADEEAVKAFRAYGHGAEFGPVRVLFEGEDGPVTYHLALQLYNHNDYRRLYLRSAGWYEGTISAGGKSWRCMLIDYNGNATFSDRSADFQQADRIRLGTGDELETYVAGKYIRLGGVYYEPVPAVDGAFISLVPRENVPVGTVRLSSEVTRLSVGGENGMFHVDANEGIFELSAGSYVTYAWTIERRDEAGVPWRAEAASSRDAFVVREGEETTLAVGEPLVCSLRAATQQGQYAFTQGLEGHMGERISITRRGNRPPAPKLHLRSQSGEYDRTYDFSYG